MIVLPVRNKLMLDELLLPGKTLHKLVKDYVIAEVCNELGIKEHTINGLLLANGKEVYIEYKCIDDDYIHLSVVYARIVIDEDEPEKYKKTGEFFVGFETLFARDRFSKRIRE